MQASLNRESRKEATTKMAHDLYLKLKQKNKENNCKATHELPKEEEEDVDFSFSRAFHGINTRNILPDDVFYFKPLFPLFDQDLLYADNEYIKSLKANGCEWEEKNVEVAPEGCKKSKSTGFLWRLKDFMHKTKSDGRDEFVFWKKSASRKREEKAAGAAKKKEEMRERKIKVKGVKAKKVANGKTSVLSAHEDYIRRRAMEEDRRRAYLAHRAVVVGVYTNVAGGTLTRNLHPF